MARTTSDDSHCHASPRIPAHTVTSSSLIGTPNCVPWRKPFVVPVWGLLLDEMGKGRGSRGGEDLEGEIRAKFGQWTQPDPKFWIRRRLSCWRERRAYWCRCERKTCCWPDWPDRDAVLPVAGPSRRRSSRIPATSWPDRGNAAPDPPSSDDAGNFHGRDPRG